MIRNSGSRKLSVMMLVFGFAALALRWSLYATAVDAKGLLLRGHPLGIALAALTGLALTILVLAAGVAWYFLKDVIGQPQLNTAVVE